MERKLIALFIAVQAVFMPVSALAQVLDPTGEALQTEADFGLRLLSATERARDSLQNALNAQLADPAYRAPVVRSRNVAVEVVATLWNPDGDQFDTVRLIKQGTKVETVNAPHYKFSVEHDNGVNSIMSVTNRPELYVVAVIHPVFSSIGTSANPRYRLDRAVYVPTSDFLLHPSIVRAGREYLDNKVDAVFEELGALHVRSRAYPERELAEVISPSIVKAIIAIEHVSAATILKGEVDGYLDRFYSILATNEHRAYAYARSTAQARGLVQFIPGTYQSMRRIRPELTLNEDFEQGMMDPYNAIKAEIALLDYNLSVLPSEIRTRYASDEGSLGAYLAAMYNGGEARVRRAIARYGDAWSEYHGSTVNGLKRETSLYVEKYRLVYERLQADSASLGIAGLE